MRRGTILVVEDNPITRKMVRFALESEGHEVVEAGDGRSALERAAQRRPDLVVQDYVLPDMDGLHLLQELRALPDGGTLPILMVTGMASQIEELRLQAVGPTTVLPKPLEPSRMIEIVRGYLGTAQPAVGRGRRILVVDDEVLGRKLAALRLRDAGFEVETASDGEEALRMAHASPPDAILSDVLMPGLDGFGFCKALRGDGRLSRVPVILLSSAFVEEPDRRLALQMGASALLARTPDFGDAIAALSAVMERGTPALPSTPADDIDALHAERVQIQLEKQVARNEVLLRQGAIQAAALSVVRGLAQALANPRDIPGMLADVLVHCLDAAGLSTGLLYLPQADGRLRLQAQAGLPSHTREAALRCFDHPEILQRALDGGQPVAYAFGAEADPALSEFGAALERASCLIVPFVIAREPLGVLVIASDSQDLSEPAWRGFAAALANQFGQTIAVGRFMARGAASEVRYRTLMEHASDAILLLDASGVVIEANRQAEVLLGRPSGEITGRPYPDFVVPEERGPLSKGTARVEGRRFVRPDGSIVAVDLSVAAVEIGEETLQLVILHDVTERNSLEAQLRQAQKMEAIGLLAGGVAHDFNNLLGVITGYTDLLFKDLGPVHPGIKRAQQIRRAAERAADLTRQLLAFSRKQVLDPRVLDLNAIVADVEGMLRRLIGEQVHLVTAPGPDVGRVKADRGQVEQVIVNLVVNARDAMPQGGSLVLETSNADLDESYARAHADVRPGPYVLLAVTDTGHGMDAATVARIFEPFFTTKEPGKGTGLGLATVFGIVKQSGGHVVVHSEVGHGTTFNLYLPRVAEESPPATTVEAAMPTGRATETVLLVEDAEALREMIREILEEDGYTVVAAAGPEEALGKAARHEGTLDLVLTDVVMPGMGGRQMVDRLRAFRPNTRVVYMSGYAGSGAGQQAQVDPTAAFLQKPFTAVTLLRKVREAMDSPR